MEIQTNLREKYILSVSLAYMLKVESCSNKRKVINLVSKWDYEYSVVQKIVNSFNNLRKTLSPLLQNSYYIFFVSGKNVFVP